MKKKQYFKLCLIFFAVTFFALFLNGCIITVAPIVDISITNDNWTYEIYVDGSYQGKTDNNGNLTLYNISPGYHHFEAFESPSIFGRYGDKWQTVQYGYNSVLIYTN